MGSEKGVDIIRVKTKLKPHLPTKQTAPNLNPIGVFNGNPFCGACRTIRLEKDQRWINW